MKRNIKSKKRKKNARNKNENYLLGVYAVRVVRLDKEYVANSWSLCSILYWVCLCIHILRLRMFDKRKSQYGYFNIVCHFSYAYIQNKSNEMIIMIEFDLLFWSKTTDFHKKTWMCFYFIYILSPPLLMNKNRDE